MTPILRGRTYHVRVKVPTRYRHLAASSHIWRALGTDSLAEAQARAPVVRAEVLAQLADRAGHRPDETPAQRFRRISDLAASRGFVYQTAAELNAGPLSHSVERLYAAGADASRDTRDALLGVVERPQTMLSGLVEYVEALEDTQHDNRFKNEAQMKRWRAERERAVASLRAGLAAAGRPDDKPVVALTKDDAWAHHEFLKKRIHAGEVNFSTPNHDLGNISGLLRRFFASIKSDNPKIYSDVSFSDPHSKRPRKLELPAEWIEETIFRPHPSFLLLNQQAQHIVIIAAEVIVSRVVL